MSAHPSATRSARPKNRTPKYRHHRASGQGYVVLNGQAIYLGPYGDPASEQRYHQRIAEWVAAGRQPHVEAEVLTIRELIARFWIYAKQYYARPDGQLTGEPDNFRAALRPLKELYGETRAIDFGPLALRTVRQRMIDTGWCRNHVNKSISRVKLVFRWATEEELIPGSVFHALQAVAGLKRGRCGARESEPVLPVPTPHIYAIEPWVSRPVWAMIQIQLLTGTRAGELVGLRPCDLDTTGRVWIYAPTEHKTAHHGHVRSIYIGPRAQRILAPYLARPTTAYCFSPIEAEAERLAALHARRVTPLSCGNRPGTHRRKNPETLPGDHYTVASYRRAIARACDQAFPPTGELARLEKETLAAWSKRLNAEQKKELAAWRREHRWHPHQLRHNAATELRREFGLDAARVILGHRSPAVTEVYAELDQAKAIDVMLRVG